MKLSSVVLITVKAYPKEIFFLEGATSTFKKDLVVFPLPSLLLVTVAQSRQIFLQFSLKCLLYFHPLIKLRIYAERIFLFCCMNDSLQVLHRLLVLTLFAVEMMQSLFNSWRSCFHRCCFTLIDCQLKYLFNYYFEPKSYTKAIIMYFFLSQTWKTVTGSLQGQ